MPISDWSSDVCSSDLVTDEKADVAGFKLSPDGKRLLVWGDVPRECTSFGCEAKDVKDRGALVGPGSGRLYKDGAGFVRHWDQWETPGTYSRPFVRSEEHTSELQSLMRISYAVFCLKK